MKSIFPEKDKQPTEQDLQAALAGTYPLWQEIKDFTLELYPKATMEWKYPGIKFGWSFRINDKKRALVYLLPRDGFFRVALVFGQKATDVVLAADIAGTIKEELLAAPVYAEGRGIRLEVSGPEMLKDIKQLIRIKTAH